MTFPGLQCFITVAQELNYTRAAEKLFISQPGVSKHIKALEVELGTSLFDKSSTKNLTLTPAGKILYECVMRCTQDLESAKKQIRHLTLLQRLDLNFIEGNTLPDELFHAMDLFQERIRPTEMFTQSIQQKEILSSLNHDQLVYCSETELPEGDYSHVMIYQNVPLYLIASAKHPAFRDGHVPCFDDFRDSAFFYSEGFTKDYRARCDRILFPLLGFDPEKVGLRNYESVRLYLKGNRGFTLGTAFNESFHSAEIGALELPLTTNFYLVWKKHQFLNTYISELIRILQSSKPEGNLYGFTVD